MSDLPEWRTVRLDELCDINPPKPKLQGVDDGTEVLFVPMAAVDEVSGTVASPERSTVGAVGRKSYRSFTSGDVLFAKITPCMENGKAAVVPTIPTELGFGSTEFHVLRPKPGTDARLIWHLVRQQSFRDDAADHFTGTVGQLRVPADFLKSFEVRVPPDNETQSQLVALLDAATDYEASASLHLATANRTIERFRRAVIAAACSGRLTADWREQNPNCDGAEKLVSRSVYSIAEPEEGLAELPDKWAWVALGDYARCSRGRFSVRPRNDPSCFGGEHPFIQIGNLNPDGGWVRSHTQTLNAKGLSVSKKFPKGTAVIAIVGATIGNTGLLAYDMCFPDSLVGLETGTSEGNRFVELFLRDRKHAIRQASYSSGGQPNIKLESLNPYPLALPPLAEQREIVRRVNELLTLADGLQHRVHNAARRVNRSSQAVLAKAFRGELSA